MSTTHNDNTLMIWLAIMAIIATLISPFISNWLQSRMPTATASIPAATSGVIKVNFNTRAMKRIDWASRGTMLGFILLLLWNIISHMRDGLTGVMMSAGLMNLVVLILVAITLARFGYVGWLYHQARIDILSGEINDLRAQLSALPVPQPDVPKPKLIRKKTEVH